MADEIKQRSDLLKSIKYAEKSGAEKEEKAKARAAQIRATTQTECAAILEQAEKEGRHAMRAAQESARSDSAVAKEAAVNRSLEHSKAQENSAAARIPAVSNLMYRKFKKEYDVKD